MVSSLEITPSKAAADSSAAIIDVREPWEFSLATIASSELVPLSSIPGALERIRKQAEQQPVYLLCHHGVRSLQAAAWLRSQGVENCLSIAGGIDRWSAEVDGRVPRY